MALISSFLSTLIVESGRLFAWGNSEYGGTGLGKETDKILTATEVPVSLQDSGDKVSEVSTGGTFSHLVTEKGHVYAMGYGLGLGFPKPAEAGDLFCLRPKKLTIPTSEKIVRVCGSADFAVAVSGAHEVFSWGWGAQGQLGLDSKESVWTPTRLTLPSEISGVHSLACGNQHVMMVVTEKE